MAQNRHLICPDCGFSGCSYGGKYAYCYRCQDGFYLNETSNVPPTNHFISLNLRQEMHPSLLAQLLIHSFGEDSYSHSFFFKVVMTVGKEAMIEYYEKTKTFLNSGDPNTSLHTYGGWFLKFLKQDGYSLN